MRQVQSENLATFQKNHTAPKGDNLTFINGFGSPFDSLPALTKPSKPEDRLSSLDSTREKPYTLRENAYLDSGTTTKHFTPRKRRALTSERLINKGRTQNKTVEFLSALGEDLKADSMSRCGKRWRVTACGEHIASKIAFHRCNIRFCPVCANRRAARFVKKYLVFVIAFLAANLSYKVCLLTLTQVKIKGETKREARARILESFKKIQRQNFFNEYFAGGIWANEVTESDSGNHSHLHVFIFRRKFIDEKLLKAKWAKVSKGAKNLNIKLIEDLNGGLSEVIKYIAKPIAAENLTLESVKQLLELKGLRMIDTFGEFRAFCRAYQTEETEAEETEEIEVLKAGDRCPHEGCNKILFDVILTDAELIEYHRLRERENERLPRVRDGSSAFHSRLKGNSRIAEF